MSRLLTLGNARAVSKCEVVNLDFDSETPLVVVKAFYLNYKLQIWLSR